MAQQGIIISLDKVGNEIKHGNDDLKAWIEHELPQHFFTHSARHIVAYGQIAQWAAQHTFHYLPAAVGEFLDADEADAWLIAAALELGHTLVTYEKTNPARRSKIAIPEPCTHFKVPFCNPIEMFRRLGVKF